MSQDDCRRQLMTHPRDSFVRLRQSIEEPHGGSLEEAKMLLATTWLRNFKTCENKPSVAPPPYYYVSKNISHAQTSAAPAK